MILVLLVCLIILVFCSYMSDSALYERISKALVVCLVVLTSPVWIAAIVVYAIASSCRGVLSRLAESYRNKEGGEVEKERKYGRGRSQS